MNSSPKEAPSGHEMDRYLPIANISRIMKKAMPDNVQGVAPLLQHPQVSRVET